MQLEVTPRGKALVAALIWGGAVRWIGDLVRYSLQKAMREGYQEVRYVGTELLENT